MLAALKATSSDFCWRAWKILGGHVGSYHDMMKLNGPLNGFDFDNCASEAEANGLEKVYVTKVSPARP